LDILNNIQSNLLGDVECNLAEKNENEVSLIGEWMDTIQSTYDIDVF